jgi:hypothetical protein
VLVASDWPVLPVIRTPDTPRAPPVVVTAVERAVHMSVTSAVFDDWSVPTTRVEPLSEAPVMSPVHVGADAAAPWAATYWMIAARAVAAEPDAAMPLGSARPPDALGDEDAIADADATGEPLDDGAEAEADGRGAMLAGAGVPPVPHAATSRTAATAATRMRMGASRGLG